MESKMNISKNVVMFVFPVALFACGNKSELKESPEVEFEELQPCDGDMEENVLKEEPRGPKEYVGIWRVTNTAFKTAMITEIYKQDGDYYVLEYDEGKNDKTPDKVIKKGNKYRDPENAFGEYYLVTSSGELRFCDDEHGDFTKKMGYRTRKIK